MLIDLALFSFPFVLFKDIGTLHSETVGWRLSILSIPSLDRTLVILFQPYNITPSCSGVLAPEIVLDGVGEHIGFALLVLLSVLLSSKDYGLGPIHLVYPVYQLVQRLQLLESFGVDVKEI